MEDILFFFFLKFALYHFPSYLTPLCEAWPGAPPSPTVGGLPSRKPALLPLPQGCFLLLEADTVLITAGKGL